MAGDPDRGWAGMNCSYRTFEFEIADFQIAGPGLIRIRLLPGLALTRNDMEEGTTIEDIDNWICEARKS